MLNTSKISGGNSKNPVKEITAAIITSIETSGLATLIGRRSYRAWIMITVVKDVVVVEARRYQHG